MPTTAKPPGDNKVVDDFFLEEQAPTKEAERNMPGAWVTLTMDGGERHDALLWGMAEFPYAIDVDGTSWSVDLRRKRYPLPFTIHLDKFTRELHPRTQMPSAFRSDVTKIEDGREQRIKIEMNAPLRHEGYTFFQASFVEADPMRGMPMMSTFAVVNDPADQIPLYSCIVISFGMLLHFTLKLLKYLKKETRRARREKLA
jgi:cytochrome c biogenesis protein ResB